MPKTSGDLLFHLCKLIDQTKAQHGYSISVVVTLVTGDSLQGTISEFYDGGFMMESQHRMVFIPLSGIASVSLNPNVMQ